MAHIVTIGILVVCIADVVFIFGAVKVAKRYDDETAELYRSLPETSSNRSTLCTRQ